ncbi:MAG: hemolysin secretion protein D [Alphaproteobacteria bacterium RIFCSPHIGHO2_12_FULL_66_14]|jgi:HlyD family secretion protein|nr:MAG: hemolysin secretion protein D [Alphaproteobacteria bacterium RIFCSPHIGHO2_12_FULL_66_14]
MREPDNVRDGLRGYLGAGLAGVFLLVGGVGGWAATASLAGAIVAPGTVVVDTNVKKVQHPTGGVVSEIRVRDGDAVGAGDIVMRLDETIARASLGVITTQLDELAVRQARLKAERDEAELLTLPASLQEREAAPELMEMIAGERTLFESRRSGRLGQKAQLAERINQLDEEVGGLEALLDSKVRELALVTTELGENRKLWKRKLIPLAKYTALQREEARIAGERANLVATIARTRARIAETRLQVIGLEQDHRTEVMKELRDAQAKWAELTERRAAAEDMLKRVEIRAPRAGIVHQLAVHTVGGVVGPGEQVMQIVPEGETLVIEARIAPRDIDQVHVGQDAVIRFPAFNQRTTPEFGGTVTHVAADLTRDPQTGESYFAARLALAADALRQAGAGTEFRLQSGMSAEIYGRTVDRTALSYLVKPLTDQIARAFRER